MSQYRAKMAMRPRGRSVVAGLEASLRLARANSLEGGDPPKTIRRRSRSVAAQMEASLQPSCPRTTSPVPARPRGPEPVDEERRREELRALRARMAKANEALWSTGPWKWTKNPTTSGTRDQGSPRPTPASTSSADTTRSRAPSSSAPSRHKPTRNWAEWPAEHRLEYMRVLSGHKTQPAEPPKQFRPRASRIPDPRPVIPLPRTVGDEEWEVERVTGCWNCGQNHRLRDCPDPVRNRRFCFGCGRLDVTKRHCPECKEWWREGIQEYWKESLGVEM